MNTPLGRTPINLVLAYNKLGYYIAVMITDPHLTRSLGFLLGDVSRLVRARFDTRAQSLGLTRAQWRVLARLRRREGINQTELAEILEIETITLGRHIDRLEAKGWVERRRDPADRRAWNLYLNTKVQPVLDGLRAFSEITRKEALAGIPESDSERLIDMLLQIKGNMLELERAEKSSEDASEEDKEFTSVT
jgi:MarR family transcriptional regulator, transcriptional regulator for hemolysin